MAAQFNAMNGFPDRGPEEWINLARTSLPVPVSPVINTETEAFAARFGLFDHRDASKGYVQGQTQDFRIAIF